MLVLDNLGGASEYLSGVGETLRTNPFSMEGLKAAAIPATQGGMDLAIAETRRINKQENGLTQKTITINGIFKNPDIDDDVKKLEIIRGTLQVTDQFPFGVVGFDSPNAERFSLDPEDGNSPSEQGFTVKQTTIGFVGQKKTRYAFQITLSFGGTVVLPTV